MRIRRVFMALGLAALAGGGLALAQEPAPWGTEADTAYADALYGALLRNQYLGHFGPLPAYDGPVPTGEFEQRWAHGAVLLTLEGQVEVQDRMTPVIVKKNYMAEGLTVEDVVRSPNEYLVHITVMAKREPGYDPDNQNWFYVRYFPDGSIERDGGVAMAGRVGKDAGEGCIRCHVKAPGGDYVFRHDRFAQ